MAPDDLVEYRSWELVGVMLGACCAKLGLCDDTQLALMRRAGSTVYIVKKAERGKRGRPEKNLARK